MSKERIKILITGAAGHIAYSLIFQLIYKATYTDLFDGKELDLYLHDLEVKKNALRGVKMEVDDAAFTKLGSISYGSSLEKICTENLDYALLVGAFPRSQGMQRVDLLEQNGQIFQQQGRVLDQCPGVKVLVVGNPCNTNALVFYHNTKNMDPKNIRAMTRLDQNRALHQLAKALEVKASVIENLVVWGNHSTTMVPDFTNIRIAHQKKHVDRSFLEKDYMDRIQKRGSEVISLRGSSSAASAAKAIVDSIEDWQGKTKGWYSAAVYSAGNPYGIDPDLFFSFPMERQKIVEGLALDPFILARIKESQKELLQERELILSYYR